MKITVKTLQQTVFHIDADPTETVGDLKTKIKDLHGHAVEAQKLIYAGRVLVDSKKVEECNIKEKDFLVLMVSKPRAPLPGVPAELAGIPTTAAPAPPPAQPATAAVTEVAPAPSATSAPAPSSTTTPASAAQPAQPAQTGLTGDTSFVTGETLQTTINNMVEMGFPRDQVMRALRASFNNPDRAVEYLMTGIPEHLLESAQPHGPPQPAAPAQPAQPASAPASAPAPGQPQNLFQLAQQQQQQGGNFGAGAGGVGGVGGAGGAGLSGADLVALRDNPQMTQLRELVAQNPALLQPLIQQLAESNPGLARAIAQNPEMLLHLLGPESEGEEGQPQVIQVTPEEQAAIERLEALGFPRQAAIEAYFACDKNEELAANYLFEGGFDNE